MTDPRDGYERAVRDLVAGLDGWINKTIEEYGRAVDYVLSPGIGSIIEGVSRLVGSGHVGDRIDPGTIETVLSELAYDVGWCRQHDQMLYDCERESCEDAARWHEENNSR
jgi:hypothetical protein